MIKTERVADQGASLHQPANRVADRTCWLPRHRRSVGRARELLREHLVELAAARELTDLGELVISELVTNAVVHAHVSPGRLIKVRLELQLDGLRIEVHDASSDQPVLRSDDNDVESGRGLWLVDALALEWGCCPRADGIGKLVWALLRPESGG